MFKNHILYTGHRSPSFARRFRRNFSCLPRGLRQPKSSDRSRVSAPRSRDFRQSSHRHRRSAGILRADDVETLIARNLVDEFRLGRPPVICGVVVTESVTALLTVLTLLPVVSGYLGPHVPAHARGSRSPRES